MATKTFKAVCDACDGTGVYCGFAEPEGVGVVCLNCDGTGCLLVTVELFKERKRKKGVKTVRLSRGTFIATGVGPTGNEISYKDFLKGRMPKND